MKKKKLHMKRGTLIVSKIIGVIAVLLLIFFIGYNITLDKFKSVGYSKDAAINIIKLTKINYAFDNPNNKTLDRAFSDTANYKEKNLDKYKNIKYVNHKDLISNINALLKKGYTVHDINLIISHGSNDDVKDFIKHDKIQYVEEFFDYPYAKIKNYDRYNNLMNDTGDDEETTICKVNMDVDKENYKDYVTVTDRSKYVLANKHHYLGPKYRPKLVKVSSKYLINPKEDVKGTNEAVSYAIKMIEAAKKDGLNLLINSGYRSFKDQQEVYDTYKNLYGEEYCLKYVMLPGFSEHQTGYSFDFGSGTNNIFKNSEEYKWLIRNSYKYGFIYRYLKSKEDITGVRAEAWHFRYVGVKASKVIDAEELSFEEYYAKYLDN